MAFKPDGEGNIEPENVPIFSMKDARKITDLPPTTIGSMREDSLELYDLDLENPKFSELVQQVFLFNDETSEEAKNNIWIPTLQQSTILAVHHATGLTTPYLTFITCLN